MRYSNELIKLIETIYQDEPQMLAMAKKGDDLTEALYNDLAIDFPIEKILKYYSKYGSDKIKLYEELKNLAYRIKIKKGLYILWQYEVQHAREVGLDKLEYTPFFINRIAEIFGEKSPLFAQAKANDFNLGYEIWDSIDFDPDPIIETLEENEPELAVDILVGAAELADKKSIAFQLCRDEIYDDWVLNETIKQTMKEGMIVNKQPLSE